MPSILMANKRGKLHEASASGNHLQLPFRDPPEGIFNFLRRKKSEPPKNTAGRFIRAILSLAFWEGTRRFRLFLKDKQKLDDSLFFSVDRSLLLRDGSFLQFCRWKPDSQALALPHDRIGPQEHLLNPLRISLPGVDRNEHVVGGVNRNENSPLLGN